MLASAMDSHDRAPTTWSSCWFFPPPSSLYTVLNRQTFSQGSGPRGLHIHTEPAGAGSFSDIAVLWYFSFLFTDTQHISQKLATVIYSIPSVDGFTRDSARNLDSSPFVYSAGTREPGMPINGGLCMQPVRHTRGG